MSANREQTKMRSGAMSALYYPYSRCVDLSSLKLMALLHEELVFVDPLEDAFREFLLTTDKGCHLVPSAVRDKWKTNRDSWDQLQDAGILKTIDPTPVLSEHDSLLTAAFASDMADSEFVKYAELKGLAAGPWKMLQSRLPPSVNNAFTNHESLVAKIQGPKAEQHIFSEYQTGVFAWEQYDHYGYREYVLQRLGGRKLDNARSLVTESKLRKTMRASALSDEEQLFLSGGGTCTSDGSPFGAHPYDYVNTVKAQTGEPIRILAFSQGSSLALSQAILIADIHGLTPITDSPLHQELLAIKYKRALLNASSDLSQPTAVRRTATLERRADLARTILLEACSRSALDNLTMADVIRYKDANREALSRYWIKVAQLESDLGHLSERSSSNRAVLKLIDTTVMPELRRLADSLQDTRRKMFGSILTRAATSIPASAALSVIMGVSGGQLLGLGVGAGLAAFGLAVPSVVTYWQERSQLGQNWLSFAFDLRRKTER